MPYFWPLLSVFSACLPLSLRTTARVTVYLKEGLLAQRPPFGWVGGGQAESGTVTSTDELPLEWL